jgi:hypothetical protein
LGKHRLRQQQDDCKKQILSIHRISRLMLVRT